MARLLRGDVWWANLGPGLGSEQSGRRPALILSHEVFNDRSGTVIALMLTSKRPRLGFPLTLESKALGLSRQSWIKIGQVRTLAVERLGDYIGSAPPEEVVRAVEGLNEIIGR
ncbi:MAG: type II toxin-antitoxin system PemK/MazF family toxin [Trueperaceae bacterium]|nr:type II toxin-antitoxin system PemK/MazF family toxin [Trueperaceae bacterium]